VPGTSEMGMGLPVVSIDRGSVGSAQDPFAWLPLGGPGQGVLADRFFSSKERCRRTLSS
jgi:hypothetical protein